MNRLVLFKKKTQLVKAAADSENSGLCKHKTGNLSIINREEGYIVITPSGLSKSKLIPEDLIVTDLDGKILENIKNNKPSIELPMHLACYSKRQDIESIVHTHSTYATAFSVRAMEIPPVATEAVFYGSKTVVIPYGKPGTKELANTVKKYMADSDALLLEKHGVIALGKEVEETLLKAKYIEEVAKVASIARLL